MMNSNHPVICYSCDKRKKCHFGQELDRALVGLGSMVSKEARAQIREIVGKDITCPDYKKENA